MHFPLFAPWRKELYKMMYQILEKDWSQESTVKR